MVLGGVMNAIKKTATAFIISLLLSTAHAEKSWLDFNDNIAKLKDYRSIAIGAATAFLVRSFLIEPYRIPSASLAPTLVPGDFILVNKHSYGFKIPFVRHQLIEMGNPKRGDLAVFKPPHVDKNYIKRVIGVPGDRIQYDPVQKKLTINNTPINYTCNKTKDQGNFESYDRCTENLMGINHEIYINKTEKPNNQNTYLNITLKKDEYFMMGDNRDNSLDSRFFGPVLKEDFIGEAFFIWMNFNWPLKIEWSRIGTPLTPLKPNLSEL